MPLTGAATAIAPVCPRAALHTHDDQQDDRIELGLAIGGIVIRGLTHSKSWGTNRDERRKGPLDQLDPGAVRWCGSETCIASEQRGVEGCCQGDVCGVVRRKIVTEIPDPRHQWFVRIAQDGHRELILDRLLSPLGVYAPSQGVTP